MNQDGQNFNRVAQGNDALVQGAVEDLIKRKFMFQAQNAQQLYSHIYNTGKKQAFDNS